MSKEKKGETRKKTRISLEFKEIAFLVFFSLIGLSFLFKGIKFEVNPTEISAASYSMYLFMNGVLVILLGILISVTSVLQREISLYIKESEEFINETLKKG